MKEKEEVPEFVTKVADILEEKLYEKRDYPEFYIFGSRLYEMSDEKSDYDIFVPFNGRFKKIELQFEKEEFNIHIKDQNTFSKLIEEQDPFCLTILWTPDKFIYKTPQNDSRYTRPEPDLHFNQDSYCLNGKLLQKNFIAEKNLCLHKSERYFKNNKRISLKNMIHAIRYLLFGNQIIENRKIVDYTVANEYQKKIFELSFDTWKEYYDEFSKILQQVEEKFNKNVNEYFKEIEFYDKKPKNSLSTLEYLKNHTLDELSQNYDIRYRVEKKTKNITLDTRNGKSEHLIQQECYSLLIDEKFNCISWAGLNTLYHGAEKAPKLNYEKLFYSPIDAKDNNVVVYYDQTKNEWNSDGRCSSEVLGKIADCFPELKSKCFVLVEDENQELFLDRVWDKTTFTEDDLQFYSKILDSLSDIVDKEEEEEPLIGKPFNIKTVQYIETDLKKINIFLSEYREYRPIELLVKDNQNNRCIFGCPANKIVPQIQKKEISENDGFLMLIKSHPKYLDEIAEYLQFEIGFRTTMKFDILVKQYRQMIEKIQIQFDQGIEDEALNEIFLHLKNQRDIHEYFIENDFKVLKNLINFKFKSKKMIPFLHDQNLCELLPVEVFEIIFSFLPKREIKYLSLVVSNSFNWIRNNEYLVSLILKNVKKLYDRDTFESILPFFETSKFELFSRMLPYSKQQIGQTISLYDNLYLLKPRKLNELELELFNVYNEEKKLNSHSIVSYNQFLENLEKYFKFSKWKDSINWRHFRIIGGSILKCLLKKSFETEKQDIDIFYYGDYYSFDSSYYDFYIAMDKYSPMEDFHDDYVDRVRTMYLEIDDVCLNFQFILYNSNKNRDHFFQILDQDCCQVGFDGKRVIASYSFIQSLNTGTMMNYHLQVDNYCEENTFNRIKKYISRGFTFISPKNFDFVNCSKFYEFGEKLEENSKEIEQQEDFVEEKEEDDSDASYGDNDEYSMAEKAFEENRDDLKVKAKAKDLLLK
eukprot:gene5453-9266_t